MIFEDEVEELFGIGWSGRCVDGSVESRFPEGRHSINTL
jgi:hypothetical protein